MKKRVISVAALIPLMSVCIFACRQTRILFFMIAGILCAIELCRNLERLNVNCIAWIMVAYLTGQAILTLCSCRLNASCVLFLCVVYAAGITGLFCKQVAGKGVMATMAGLVYPCLIFGLLIVIAGSDVWLEVFSLSCVSTWICDSFAMFGGRRFGKNKIAPDISPNKTVEGCIFGAISSLLAGITVWMLGIVFKGKLFGCSYISFSLWQCELIAFTASTMGQLGDLVESMLKRMIGVKDFSQLIPGHGGMLDRADSLMFSIPTAYMMIVFLSNIA